MKKYLAYDESTGEIRDADGGLVATNLPGFKGISIEPASSVEEIIRLKNAGFSAEEILRILATISKGSI